MNRFAALLLLALVPTERLSADTVQQKQQASLSVSIDKTDATLPFVETLAVTITVDGKEGLEVELPESILPSDEHWKLLSLGPTKRQSLPKQRVRWQRVLLFEPISIGTHALNLNPLRFRNPGEDWKTVAWDPISIEVTINTSDAGMSSLRDNTGIEKLPALDPRPIPWYWWALAGVIVIAAVAYALRKRRFNLSRRETPSQTALRELDRLAGLDLPSAGKAARFHAMVANVLRRYLERQLSIPATSRTTAEFVRQLEKDNSLTSEQQEELRVLFERCDLVKFARVAPTGEECLAVEAQVRRFVAETSSPLD